MRNESAQVFETELLTGDEAVQARRLRGMEIAAACRITKKDGHWVVPSVSGNGRYNVNPDPAAPHCTCPDHETRGCKCKHIFAVEYVLKREQNPDGTTTVTESFTVSATKRTTYAQNWPAYNAAQTNEKREFQKLLHNLCNGIQEPAQGKGRPRLPLADAVFAVAFKIYSTVSGRRFISDLCEAQASGFMSRVPHFNSIFNYLESPEMTDVLTDLIIQSSLPLKALETDFAIDSTGFASSRFVRWYDHKYNCVRQDHDWVKAHLICGVKTNVVTAVEIHGRNASDTPRLPSLLATTAQNFNVRELSADKAYASQKNFAAIEKHGATPFISFKSHHTGSSGGLFAKAFHFFSLHQEKFLAHYHKRSNVESTMMMIKTKFGDAVRSKTDVAMKNEVLAKVLCHNICCLISAMYELGISTAF
jgi:transposase